MSVEQDEIARFKSEINLFQVAEEYGFIQTDKSSGSSRHYRDGAEKGSDKITVSFTSGIYIYKSWSDENDKGTILDFVRNRESGKNFGQLRILLRKYLGNDVTRPVAVKSEVLRPGTKYPRPKFSIAEEIAEDLEVETKEDEPKKTFEQIQAEWDQLAPYSGDYLSKRGLTREKITSFDVRVDERNNACFPHRNEDGVLSGWEKKNAGFTGFSSGGYKFLMIGRLDKLEVKRVVITEASIDAISYCQLKHQPGDLYVSTSGTTSSIQLTALVELIELHANAVIVCAHDADDAGDAFANGVSIITPKGTTVVRDRPLIKFPKKDWNDVLQESLVKKSVYPKRHEKRYA